MNTMSQRELSDDRTFEMGYVEVRLSVEALVNFAEDNLQSWFDVFEYVMARKSLGVDECAKYFADRVMIKPSKAFVALCEILIKKEYPYEYKPFVPNDCNK